MNHSIDSTPHSRRRGLAIAALASTLGAAVAFAPLPAESAGAGTREINQAAALAGGVTPGDTPGFPVTISEPGSYRLTSNLIVDDANQTAIAIDADDVRLDLRGFLVGCGQASGDCGPGGGDGIAVVGVIGNHSRTHVRDGTVAGMGDYGLVLGSNSSVEGVRVFSNGDDGMLLGSHSRVLRSIARENTGNGIRILSEGTISESIASLNGGDGFDLGADSGISRCVARNNDSAGVRIGARGSVGVCYVAANDGDGVRGGVSTTMRSVVSRQNGGAGLGASAGSLAQGNAVSENAGPGLDLGAQSGYRANLVASSNGSTVNPGPLNLGVNVCGEDLVCP